MVRGSQESRIRREPATYQARADLLLEGEPPEWVPLQPGARIADVSAALLPLPLRSRGFRERGAEAVRRGQYWKESTGIQDDDEGPRVLRGPRLTLRLATAKRLHSVDKLVDDGFLTVSDEYERFVLSCRAHDAPQELSEPTSAGLRA